MDDHEELKKVRNILACPGECPPFFDASDTVTIRNAKCLCALARLAAKVLREGPDAAATTGAGEQ